MNKEVIYLNKLFSSNLKYLRNNSGIEQLELANMLGLKSASAVSEWEKGVRIPNAGVLSDIANIFNVTLDNLMKTNLEKHNIGSYNSIPLLGTIAAGLLAEENIKDYFNLDSKIKADFALEVKGDSMINAGIFEGDIVFIRKQECLENGEIGAVQIENIETEATLKKFYFSNDIIQLLSENPNYPPQIYTEGNIRILGKLVAVLNIRG
jgi:repressor LexA